ncbi:hypothetical protein [Lachnobacterium bovis]
MDEKKTSNQIIKIIGKTTYIVSLHFKDKGKTFYETLKRVLKVDSK